MMRFLIVVILFTCTKSWAQVNYVRNPSLEQYSHCPNNYDQIKEALFWSPLDTNGIFPNTPLCSPEYCNACDVGNSVGVPIGFAYYHYARTGNGMAEVQMYSDELHAPDYKRDYLQGRFYKHLIAGKSYCGTFFVTLEQASYYAIKNVAAYMDDGSIDNTDSAGCALPQTAFSPQIIDTNVINDTLNWIKVQGSFTAMGTEQFITIGNFSDVYHTLAIVLMDTTGLPALGWGGFTWYLVDDVSVIESDAVANAGFDKTIPPGSPDSVVIGDTLDTYLPTYWYTNGLKIDSNKSSIKVHPDTTTKYAVSLDVCGHITYDTVVVQRSGIGFDAVSGKMKNVYIYPNPVMNNFTVVNAANYKVTVCDIIGKVVYRLCISSDNEMVNISELTKGTYMCQIMEMQTGIKKTVRITKE